MTNQRKMVENGDNKQRIEYAKICKTVQKKAGEDIRKYNQDIIRETIVTSKSLRKVHTDQKEITSWKVEAALRDMKNVTATGYDHINI